MDTVIERLEKRTGFMGLLKDTLIMAKRDLLKIKHNPDSLMDVTLVPVIFMLLFTCLFGGAIAGNISAYLPTIVPGIFVFQMISATSGAGTQLREDMETGVFDRFKSLPIARVAPLTGILLTDIVRYIIAAIFSLGTGIVMGWRPTAGFVYLIPACFIVFFACWCVSWIFALVGILVKSSGTISGVSMLISMLLGFLSNAIVSPDTFPAPLRIFAKINPVTHLVNAFNAIVNTGTFGAEAMTALGVSAVFAVIIIPVTIIVYRKKI
jgi:ABC-2 type transport system permease protein